MISCPLSDVVRKERCRNYWHMWGRASGRLLYFDVQRALDKVWSEPIRILDVGSLRDATGHGSILSWAWDRAWNHLV